MLILVVVVLSMTEDLLLSFLYIRYLTISKGQKLHEALGLPALACDSCLSWHRYYCPLPMSAPCAVWALATSGGRAQLARRRAGSQDGGQSQSQPGPV